MVEEIKQNEETSKEETPKSIVEEARIEREKLEKVLEENKTVLARIEQIKAQDLLGGRALAGSTKPVVDKDKEEKERINKILEKTGLRI